MNARQEYAQRLSARRELVAEATALEDRWSNARLLVFVSFLALLFLRFRWGSLPLWCWAAPPVLFVWAWSRHHRAREVLERARFAVAYYERGIARLEDRWAGTGATGAGFADPHHPYALDLDLFGNGSLFQRLCAAQTTVGEECLAGWLCRPAPAAEIRARQDAIRELRDEVDWREKLATTARETSSVLEVRELLAWAAAEPVAYPAWAPPLALVLALLTVVGAGGAGLGYGLLPFVIFSGAQSLLAWWLGASIQRIISDITTPVRELDALSRLLRLWEGRQWKGEGLRLVAGELSGGEGLPSLGIRQLGRLVDLLDSRRNQFFAPIAFLLGWEMQIAFLLESWRRRSGPSVGRWLAAVARLEALSSLASYTFENPDDVFATFVDEKGLFEAEALGHPLLARAQCVANDVALGSETRLLLVSGSNMSGKSTLLRAIGINAVLAQAGAPVRAKSLRLSEVAIGATLRVQDDLQTGTSRFYAELLRLRLVTELTADSRPVLFLLDEILHGTNSHDRVTGAQAILRGLVRRGAFGAVTTHDLALTQLVEDKDVRARNVFFADHFEGGKMRFDYRMREGVISHSNALELMRSVGLDVD